MLRPLFFSTFAVVLARGKEMGSLANSCLNGLGDLCQQLVTHCSTKSELNRCRERGYNDLDQNSISRQYICTWKEGSIYTWKACKCFKTPKLRSVRYSWRAASLFACLRCTASKPGQQFCRTTLLHNLRNNSPRQLVSYWVEKCMKTKRQNQE